MLIALEEANAAYRREEVPVGAVVLDPLTGEVIARGGNRTIADKDPGAHAEMLAIREACRKLGAARIPGMHIYVTLEPCPMCATAISFARIEKVIFGASDPKGGGIIHGPKIYEQPTCHHRPEVVGGIEEERCGQILKDFFRERRQAKREEQRLL